VAQPCAEPMPTLALYCRVHRRRGRVGAAHTNRQAALEKRIGIIARRKPICPQGGNVWTR
jgi:hypothetical protein